MLNRELENTGDGATIVVKSDNIQLDKGLFSDVYLKLFATKSEYWGNSVFDINFNSQTPQSLFDNSTDPTGIENIKRAVEFDLSKITYASFIVTITVKNNTKIVINIEANNNQTMQIIWDETQKQVIETTVI